LGLAGCSLHYTQPVISEKAVEAGPFVWDFGLVKEGAVLKHAFTLKNDYAKILNIKNVDTSCGCTVSKINKKKILPGEIALIEVRFNTKGYSGSVQQFVYVETDNIDDPILKFIIKAEVTK
jgi:hypothetical protein